MCVECLKQKACYAELNTRASFDKCNSVRFYPAISQRYIHSGDHSAWYSICVDIIWLSIWIFREERQRRAEKEQTETDRDKERR